MKEVSILLILGLLALTGCDRVSSYTFNVKNSTQDTIALEFLNEGYPPEQEENVILLPTEEKKVRIIYGPLNSPAHDCLNEHGIGYFVALVFDTYVNGEKLEKQLWVAENWTYNHKSKYQGEYNMIITNEMIEK